MKDDHRSGECDSKWIRTCYLCGDPDHTKKDCPQNTNKESKATEEAEAAEDAETVEEASEETETGLKDQSETSTDPTNQQMETEPCEAETAEATIAIDPILSVDEANEEVAGMIKAKTAKNKKRSIQNSPGKPKENTKKIIRKNISNQFK